MSLENVQLITEQTGFTKNIDCAIERSLLKQVLNINTIKSEKLNVYRMPFHSDVYVFAGIFDVDTSLTQFTIGDYGVFDVEYLHMFKFTRFIINDNNDLTEEEVIIDSTKVDVIDAEKLSEYEILFSPEYGNTYQQIFESEKDSIKITCSIRCLELTTQKLRDAIERNEPIFSHSKLADVKEPKFF